MILAKNCGLSRVAATLASQFEGKENNYRQRLREWYWDEKSKQGQKRVDWSVAQSFAPLLRWILRLWPAQERRLPLAMDATTLKERFVVLSLSVVYRGCAIPIAWAVLRAGQPGSWKEPWLGLFQSLEGVVPSDWKVIVMADRGLYARWLYVAIQAMGWHPFLRINLGGSYHAKGKANFQPMSQLLPSPGQTWVGEVTCFASQPLEATLLACWGPNHKEPWLILTDLPTCQASATWYGLRSWIEAGFKDLKRDGWQWQNTRMTDPARAARLWLALAVATLWVVNVGGAADHELPANCADALSPNHIVHKTKFKVSQPRLLSCFSRGLSVILAHLLHRYPIRLVSFIPQPWPQDTYP